MNTPKQTLETMQTETLITPKEHDFTPPPVQMIQMITGFWTSCCIYAAAKLNIADMLAAGPKTLNDLAEKTSTHAPSLYRLMRALCSVGIFMENEKGEFEINALGSTLQSDIPGSMKSMAIAQLGDHFSAWGNLLHSIKTGDIAFDNLHGMTIWKYYETNPEDGANFAKAMSGLTQGVIMNILPNYDFSSSKTIVDIGGGNGALLCAVLNTNPTAKGIVFDEAYIQGQANANIKELGMQERCEFNPGSFFDSIPTGGDLYMMKMILHDWTDAQSKQILDNTYKSMKSGNKLLIIESVISERNIPHPGKLMDINMLAMTGGRERTGKEWKSLIENSGFKLNQIIPTFSPMFSIIEVEKE